MTARRTTCIDSALLRKLTGTAYESYDCGRCKIYRLDRDLWVGVRAEREEIIKGRDPASIKTRHDCMEAAERRVKAGLDDYKTGVKKNPREIQERRAEQAFQRVWMTRAWV